MVLEGLHGLAMASGEVERSHVLADEPLTEGVVSHQAGEGRDDAGVTTPKLELAPLLHGAEVELADAAASGRRNSTSRPRRVRRRRGQRLGEAFRRQQHVAAAKGRLRLAHKCLEAPEVHVDTLRGKVVAGGRADDHRAGSGRRQSVANWATVVFTTVAAASAPQTSSRSVSVLTERPRPSASRTRRWRAAPADVDRLSVGPHDCHLSEHADVRLRSVLLPPPSADGSESPSGSVNTTADDDGTARTSPRSRCPGLHAAGGSPRRRPGVTGAGLTGVRFHDLRHHYASVLLSAGVSIRATQVNLGHASAKVILDVWPLHARRREPDPDRRNLSLGAPRAPDRTDGITGSPPSPAQPGLSAPTTHIAKNWEPPP